MPKLLCAVMTCHMLDYFIDENTQDWLNTHGKRCLDQQARVTAIRETWLKDLPPDVDYKFFYGKRLRGNRTAPFALREPLADEVFLDCGDSYTSNPEKMKAISRWTLERDYTHLLRTDDDTFVYPKELLATNWADHNYSGSGSGDFHPGGCLFLSRRAMRHIVDAKVTNFADDIWMGEVLKKNGCSMNRIASIHNEWGDGYQVDPEMHTEGKAALHSCTPDAMRRLWTRQTTLS